MLYKKIVSHPLNLSFFYKNKTMQRSIESLIDRMPPKILEFFLRERVIIFLPITGIYSCAIDQTNNDYLILLFPDLIKKLHYVDNREGLAILAHELGHFYHQHSKNNTPKLKAQVEADDFAHELGLSRELSEVLSKFNDIDSKTRLSYLTAKILSSGLSQ